MVRKIFPLAVKFGIIVIILAGCVFAIAVKLQEPKGIGAFLFLVEAEFRQQNVNNILSAQIPMCDRKQLSLVSIPLNCKIARTFGGYSSKCNWYEMNMSPNKNCGYLFVSSVTPPDVVDKIKDILERPCEYYMPLYRAAILSITIGRRLGCLDDVRDNSYVGLYTLNLSPEEIGEMTAKEVYDDYFHMRSNEIQ